MVFFLVGSLDRRRLLLSSVPSKYFVLSSLLAMGSPTQAGVEGRLSSLGEACHSVHRRREVVKTGWLVEQWGASQVSSLANDGSCYHIIEKMSLSSFLVWMRIPKLLNINFAESRPRDDALVPLGTRDCISCCSFRFV